MSVGVSGGTPGRNHDLRGVVLCRAAGRIDRRLSRLTGRVTLSVFVYACCSTALLCPLVFGFPTEMWFAHAILWPTPCAVSLHAKRTIAETVLVFIMLLILAFTHKGTYGFDAVGIVATLASRGLRERDVYARGDQPDDHCDISHSGENCGSARRLLCRRNFECGTALFDPAIFQVDVVLVLLAAVTAYGVILMLLSIWLPRWAWVCALASIPLGSLSIYWLHFDHSVHASSRYYLRTALVIATPLLGALASLAAMTREGIVAGLPAEAAARPDLSRWRQATRPHLNLPPGDLDPCDRNREIRRCLDSLP